MHRIRLPGPLPFQSVIAFEMRTHARQPVGVAAVQQRVSPACRDEHGFAALSFQQDVCGAPDVEVGDASPRFHGIEPAPRAAAMISAARP